MKEIFSKIITEKGLSVGQAEDDFQPMALKNGAYAATLSAFRVQSFDFWYYSSLAGPFSWQVWMFYYNVFVIPIQALAILFDIATLWKQDYRWFYALYPFPDLEPVDWRYFYYIIYTQLYLWGIQTSFAWICFVPGFSAVVNYFLIMNIIVAEARIECLLQEDSRPLPVDYSECLYDSLFWTEYILEDEKNKY